MSKQRRKAVFLDSLKKAQGAIFAYLITAVISFVIFKLYKLNMEPFFYSLTVVIVVGGFFFMASFIRNLKRAKDREWLKSGIMNIDELPETCSLSDADYQEIIMSLKEQMIRMSEEFDLEKKNTDDYLTAWVHQIKTPIAVLRMMIDKDDTEEHKNFAAELFRIEQYVDMVLQYIRLESSNNDLLVEEYSLDEMIRTSIRKFAPQFIMKKLALHYDTVDDKIITDKKWFCCILDQLISNAVKYTPGGSVSIYLDDEKRLCIEDTGIGIAAEDQKLIFEKGYTGVNGRINSRSSGLGLYLAQRAAKKLSIKISVASKPGEGSVFMLGVFRDE